MKTFYNLALHYYFVFILFITFIPFSVLANDVDETEIRQVLKRQTHAWNSGDIPGFMNGYWKSDSLIFIGENGPTYGYRTTLQNYKNRYPETTAMGKLHFDLVQIKRLSPQYYFVTGKWALRRTIGDLQGYFTLLFQKIENKWVIICDHTS